MHNVVMQAGQDKIASLEGTFSTFCLDFFALFLLVESSSWLVAVPVKFGVFIFCCAAAPKKEDNAVIIENYRILLLLVFLSDELIGDTKNLR